MPKLKFVLPSLAAVALAISPSALPQSTSSQSKKEPAKSTAAAAPAQPASSPVSNEVSNAKLPVRRVVLYKTGVGYFEHLGRVDGNQSIRIDFTSSQLNDVLQTLTILDLNGGRVTGVNYNSEAPLSQRLGTLHLPLEADTNLSKFYEALRGARLQIRGGSPAITGRLLSVERKTRVSGGTTLEVDLITIVSESGEVRSVELTPGVSVQLAEGEVNQEVSRYLHLLASVRQEGLRRMTIDTAGSGDRQLYVSYISEVPIWKTSYRVVLPSKTGEEPLLQGWAIVDNTVGEDWNDVELSLVAGAPQSFIEQLSQPYYSRRPVVPLPQAAQLSPQTHEGAMQGGSAGLSGRVLDPTGAVVPNAQVKLFSDASGLLQTASTNNQGKYEFGDVPAGSYHLEITYPGFKTSVIQGLSLGGGREQSQDVSLQLGAATTMVTVAAQAMTVNTEEAQIGGARIGSGREIGSGYGVGVGGGAGVVNPVGNGRLWAPAPPAPSIAEARREVVAAAQGMELGDFFQYKLKDRVTIHKNESALVPIIETHVASEKVSLWNPSLNSPRPLRALWLTNSSALTLDGGSFSVLEDETFAGEGLTDSIKPGEKRLVSYAVDLGMRVESRAESEPQQVTHCRVAHGVMVQTNELRQEVSYTIRNDDTTPRILVIEHPLQAGWKISEDSPKPEEATSNLDRFRVNLEPKASTTRKIRDSKALETRYEISNITDNQIGIFLKQKSINAEVEAALRKVLGQKDRVAALDAEIQKREDEKQKIYDDQQRIRENLKALKGSAEERALTQRYTQQLSDQENRLQGIETETADLQKKRDAAQSELDQIIESLSFDLTL